MGERTGRPRGRPKGKGSCCRVLRDMRWVYERPEGTEKTEGQRTLRKLMKESPREFVQQLVRLEEAEARKRAKEAGGKGSEDAGEMDEVTARVAGLLEGEWERAEQWFAAERSGREPPVSGLAAAAGDGEQAVP
jgi:SpoVK/Ycf46/Vps4 family AAA+-type ATPase